jgi:hypothetical protein
MTGVFISRGMTLGVPAGRLVLSLDQYGKLGGSLAPHVHFDVCPTWLGLALDHLERAKVCQAERTLAWGGADENAKNVTLEREFEASMQAIMSAAIAWEAFFSIIKTKTKTKVSEEHSRECKKRRTPRYAQIAGVLRCAFGLQQGSFDDLQQSLKRTFTLRNQAVHPTGDIAEPVFHPELNVGVEWRFERFRYANASLVASETVKLMCELVTSAKPQNAEARKYAQVLQPALAALHQRYVRLVG